MTRAFRLISSEPWAILPDVVPALLEAAERLEDGVSPIGDTEAVNGRASADFRATHEPTTRDGVREIPVRGPILRYANMMHMACGGASVQSIAGHLRDAVEDSSVKAVVLHFDSPGGQVSGIGELAGQIRKASGSKPVVAYIGGNGCSAAYWLASACSEIVCAPSSFLGSIGAVVQVDTKKPKDQLTFVSAQSPMKWADPTTDDGKGEMQRCVDDIGREFIACVAEYRGFAPDSVISDFGRGGTKMGRDAVSCGMADAVGDFETVVQRLARGERASGKPLPRSSIPGTPGQPPKGAMMALNPFAVIAKLWASDPAAVQAAMESDADDKNASRPADGNLSPTFAHVASAYTAKLAPAVDADALREQVKAELAAESAAAAKAEMAAFYADQAKAYFTAQVKASVVTPAEVPALSALYVAFALEDRTSPVAYKDAAGADKSVTRLSLLTDRVSRGPNARWTEELVGSDADVKTGKVLDHAVSDEDKAASVARKKAMLAATDAGKKFLAATAK